jgi:FkbM family methyltransferase
MSTGILNRLKHFVRQGPLGEPAKRLYRGMWPLRPAARDAHYNFETEQVMGRVLGAKSVGIDIGANRGFFLNTMVRLAPQARHWAFEPLPAYAALLRATFPQVEICEVALSERGGPVTFHHAVAAPGWSGLARRTVGPLATTEWETLTVAGARLDDVIPAETAVAFIKIDVEGAEYGVFRGGEQLLRRHRPVVVFEHDHANAEHYGPQSGLVYDFVRDCGMRVTTMTRWLSGQPALTRPALIRQCESGQDFCFMAHPDPGKA